MNCTVEKFNSIEEWNSLRNKGLGGSEIGTILGYNKYMSPFELWKLKTGRVKPYDLSKNEAVIRGNKAEKHLIGLFQANNPNLIVEEGNDISYVSKDRKYARANLDGIINNDTVLEIKTAKVRSMQEWNNQVPMQYYLQCMWYMYVTGFKKAVLYAMIEKIKFDNSESDYFLKTYEIDYDQEEIDYILKETDKFWEKVEKKEWDEFELKINI